MPGRLPIMYLHDLLQTHVTQGATLPDKDIHKVPASSVVVSTPMNDKALGASEMSGTATAAGNADSSSIQLHPLEMPMTTPTACAALVPQSVKELQPLGPSVTAIATPSFVTPQCQPSPTTVPSRRDPAGRTVSSVSSLESTVAITNHVIRTCASGKASPLRAGTGHPVCTPFRHRPSLRTRRLCWSQGPRGPERCVKLSSSTLALPQQQRRLLWAGQMATLWRDRVNHTIEKEVSDIDEFASMLVLRIISKAVRVQLTYMRPCTTPSIYWSPRPHGIHP